MTGVSAVPSWVCFFWAAELFFFLTGISSVRRCTYRCAPHLVFGLFARIRRRRPIFSAVEVPRWRVDLVVCLCGVTSVCLEVFGIACFICSATAPVRLFWNSVKMLWSWPTGSEAQSFNSAHRAQLGID